MNLLRRLSKSSTHSDERRPSLDGQEAPEIQDDAHAHKDRPAAAPARISTVSRTSSSTSDRSPIDASSLAGSTQIDVDLQQDPANFLPTNLVTYTLSHPSHLSSSRAVLRDGQEVFYIEHNKFHPTKSPIELKSLPDKRLLGEARYKPYNIAGLRAEIHVDSRHHSRRQYEEVGFDVTSDEGWGWSRSAPDGLEGVWKVGDMKLSDKHGTLIAVMCKARGGGRKGKKLEERLFIKEEIANGHGGGSVLEWVVLGCYAVEEAWKRTRRNVAGTVANAGNFGATVGFAAGAP